MSSRITVFLATATGGLLSVFLILFLYLSFKVDIDLLLGAKDGKTISFLSDIFLPLFSTFVGAALGSFFTYKLQAREKSSDFTAKEVYLLQQTFLALEAQLNDLCSIKKAMIYPYRKNKLRFLSLPITLGLSGVSERIDAEVSKPLIRLRESELLTRVRLAEKSYLNAIVMKSEYEALAREYVTALKANGVDQLDVTSLQRKTKAVGGALIAQLYEIGEGFISIVDDTIIEMLQAMAKLSEAYAKAFDPRVHRNLKLEVSAEDRGLFELVPTPYFKSLSQLMENSGYMPNFHDPRDDETYSITRLARPNWTSTFRVRGIPYSLESVKRH